MQCLLYLYCNGVEILIIFNDLYVLFKQSYSLKPVFKTPLFLFVKGWRAGLDFEKGRLLGWVNMGWGGGGGSVAKLIHQINNDCPTVTTI